ncbi:MAG: hypothetical protein ABI624_10015 [Casimicrobiaceae bacterium]
MPTATYTVLTRTVAPSATVTPSPTRTPTIDGADTRTATVRPTSSLSACSGDCNEDGAVSINEIIVGVNLALGSTEPSSVECSAFATEGNATVTVDQLIKAVVSSLNGCVLNATSPTPVVSDTFTPTASPSPSEPPTPATYTPTVGLDVTGIWVGPFSDSAFSGELTLDLQQTGSDVEGDLSSSLGGRSRVSGVLSGHTLTFTVVEIPGDTCPHTLTGSATVDVEGREMAGDYAGTDDCYGSRDQGTFSLSRSEDRR